MIKSLSDALLPESLLDQCIDEHTVSVVKAAGIDVCGENGGYHTLTIDGPIFQTPLDFQTGAVSRAIYQQESAVKIFSPFPEKD